MYPTIASAISCCKTEALRICIFMARHANRRAVLGLRLQGGNLAEAPLILRQYHRAIIRLKMIYNGFIRVEQHFCLPVFIVYA